MQSHYANPAQVDLKGCIWGRPREPHPPIPCNSFKGAGARCTGPELPVSFHLPHSFTHPISLGYNVAALCC